MKLKIGRLPFSVEEIDQARGVIGGLHFSFDDIPDKNVRAVGVPEHLIVDRKLGTAKGGTAEESGGRRVDGDILIRKKATFLFLHGVLTGGAGCPGIPSQASGVGERADGLGGIEQGDGPGVGSSNLRTETRSAQADRNGSAPALGVFDEDDAVTAEPAEDQPAFGNAKDGNAAGVVDGGLRNGISGTLAFGKDFGRLLNEGSKGLGGGNVGERECDEGGEEKMKFHLSVGIIIAGMIGENFRL